eukprot:m.2047 g.2047  ORF g.2047 m.2047 type:complete len:453 (+) comp8202_c0_seq2:237-1595(+)
MFEFKSVWRIIGYIGRLNREIVVDGVEMGGSSTNEWAVYRVLRRQNPDAGLTMWQVDELAENRADFLFYARHGLRAVQKFYSEEEEAATMTEKDVFGELTRQQVQLGSVQAIRARFTTRKVRPLACEVPSQEGISKMLGVNSDDDWGPLSREKAAHGLDEVNGRNSPTWPAENAENTSDGLLNEMAFKSRLDMLSTVSIADAICNGMKDSSSGGEQAMLNQPSQPGSPLGSMSSPLSHMSSPYYVPVSNGVWVTIGLPAECPRERDGDDSKSQMVVENGRSGARFTARGEATSEDDNDEDHGSDDSSRGRGSSQYQCDLCGEIFGCTNQLGQHLRIHTADKPFTCHYCLKTFTQRSHLTRHLYTHTGEKPYKCPHCEKAFARSTTLADHVNTHTHSRPHKCPHCDRAFNQKSGLRYHIRTHTGERPFQCELCQKSFISSSQLTKHTCRANNE